MGKLVFLIAAWCVNAAHRLNLASRNHGNVSLKPWDFRGHLGIPRTFTQRWANVCRFVIGWSLYLTSRALDRTGLCLGRLIGRERDGYLLGGIHGR